MRKQNLILPFHGDTFRHKATPLEVTGSLGLGVSGMCCARNSRLASWRKLGGVSQSGEGRKGPLGSPELGHGGEKAEGQSIRRSFLGAVPETGRPLEGHAQRGILRGNSCGEEARVCGLCGLRPGMKSPVLLPSLPRGQCQGPWQGQLHDGVCAYVCMCEHMPEFGVSMGGWRWWVEGCVGTD